MSRVLRATHNPVKSRIPYVVTFYSGTYFETRRHDSKGDTIDLHGFSGTLTPYRIVTQYVDQVSWSFSTVSPYETMSLTLVLPLEEAVTVFPGEYIDLKEKVKITPGFWVTVHEAKSSNISVLGDLQEVAGRMLCWGRVDSVNVSTYSDQQNGSITTNVSLSASSWIHFLDENAFFATEADSDTFQERPLTQETTRHGRAMFWDKFNNAAIKESEFNKFVSGFRATTNIPKDQDERHSFYQYNDSGDASEFFDYEAYLQSCLGKAVSSLYHAFAQDVYLPFSVSQLNPRIGGMTNFGEFVPVLYGTRGAYVLSTHDERAEHEAKGIQNDSVIALTVNRHSKKDTLMFAGSTADNSYSFNETDRSLVDLSRFGNHAAPPLGVSSSFLIKDFDGGVWTWMNSTFGIDPNVVEMFPTLIEVDTKHYLDRHKEAFRNFYMRKTKEKTPLLDAQGNEIPGQYQKDADGNFIMTTFREPENDPIKHKTARFAENNDGVMIVKRKEKDLKYIVKNADRRPRMLTEFTNPTGGTSIMVPVILYRMKPIYDPNIFSVGFNSHMMNEAVRGHNGDMNKPDWADEVTVSYADHVAGDDTVKSVFTANRFPHFCLMRGSPSDLRGYHIPKGKKGHMLGSSDYGGVHTTQPITSMKHRKTIQKVTSLNFSVSENDRVNMVSVRSPAAASTNLQFGYGFSNIRRPIMNPQSIADYGIRRQEITWNIIYNDHELYHAITEYAFEVFQLQSGHRSSGSFSCELDPEIRAGMFVYVPLGRGTITRQHIVYVEEVSHSIIVDPDGGFIGDTQVTFSQGLTLNGEGIPISNDPQKQPYQ